MKNNLTEKVPRYFEPYVNDCFHNSYAAVLEYMGLNTRLILADYLSFMYDPVNGNIGVNYPYRMNTSVEFTEEELNTSMEFVYLPATKIYSGPAGGITGEVRYKDRVNINMYIDDNTDMAYSRLKSLIDSRKPVIAAVDLYYMSYHRAYMKEHGLHCIVITGYDEKEGWFELFDKFQLSSSDFDGRISIKEVNRGRASENPLALSNNILRRPVRNLWIEIYAENDFKISNEKLMNILAESCSRMTGQKRVLGQECGLKALDSFINDLLLKKEKGLENADIDWYRTYLNMSFKNIVRNRKRFMVFVNEISSLLPENLAQEVCRYLDESSKHWDISASIALKLGIKKSLDLTDELVKQLSEVRNLESCLVEELENYIGNRV